MFLPFFFKRWFDSFHIGLYWMKYQCSWYLKIQKPRWKFFHLFRYSNLDCSCTRITIEVIWRIPDIPCEWFRMFDFRWKKIFIIYFYWQCSSTCQCICSMTWLEYTSNLYAFKKQTKLAIQMKIIAIIYGDSAYITWCIYIYLIYYANNT